MRISTLLTLSLAGAVIARPAPVAAQIHITFGARLGPEIAVSTYASDRHGDWQRNFRRWTPVTLYDVNGRYYRRPVRGARPVLVYYYRNEYFFPPQDQGWYHRDRRYNYRRRPTDIDYGRARPYTPFEIDARFGPEIGVFNFSPDRAGDWRRNYRRWTPVTVYEFHGRYFTNSGPGARPVMVYRYRDEYFLPPDDPAWNGFDRRFDYNRIPNQDDRGRVRDRP
jgi:hypothetical protein